jgi:hypothetical protein
MELVGDEDFWVGYRAAESLIGLPSGADFGWQVLKSAGTTDADARSRMRCLELMEHGGHIQSGLESAVERGEAELEQLLAALERAGSRAWSGVLT